jgi:hypothetical protein
MTGKQWFTTDEEPDIGLGEEIAKSWRHQSDFRQQQPGEHQQPRRTATHEPFRGYSPFATWEILNTELLNSELCLSFIGIAFDLNRPRTSRFSHLPMPPISSHFEHDTSGSEYAMHAQHLHALQAMQPPPNPRHPRRRTDPTLPPLLIQPLAPSRPVLPRRARRSDLCQRRRD